MDQNFVLEMPLKVEPWQADILDKRYEYLRCLYNYAQGKLLRQYNYFVQTTEYRSIKTFKEKREFFQNHTFTISGITGRNDVLVPISFSEFGLIGFVGKLLKRNTGNKSYKDLGVNSNNLAFLAKNMWSAWEKKLYTYSAKKNENKINFKKKGTLNSIEFGTIMHHGKKAFVGLEIDLHSLKLKLKTNGYVGAKSKWITLSIGKGKPLTMYESEALNLGFESLRVVSIIRKYRNGKRKYYVQMTFRGKYYDKGRKLGTGRVGIDVGPSTVAICSNEVVRIDKLASKVDNIEKEIKALQRLMDRSRRLSNPQNYNADGTIKRGKKLLWTYSNHYKILQMKARELQRHQAAVRKSQHIEMANYLLSLGNEFIVEKNPIRDWALRSQETKKDEVTGKFLSKKRFGKSIGNHAPAQFVIILKNKVLSLGGKFVEVDIKNAATQFDFTNRTFTPHSLDERRITLSDGNDHQVDMLAAFNLQHLNYESKEAKDYDITSMKEDYTSYCIKEREELNRYLKGEKKNDKYTIGAF